MIIIMTVSRTYGLLRYNFPQSSTKGALMSLASLLSHWRADPTISGNIVEWRSLPARQARYTLFPSGIHPALVQALRQQGIQALYTHQAEAWEKTRSGQNVVVVTGTASGKTLCYNLPVLDRLLVDPQARALYLFPTKALAQDQLSVISRQLSIIQGIEELQRGEMPGIPASTVSFSTYDGDTPASARSTIRANARLVISNPDMLHTGILPHHTSWADFFRNLQFVVIDEMHMYRGVFGSHVTNLLRRLKRIARHYGAKPLFILTSATIANPVQLAEWLVEEPVALVDDDGSARGARHFLIYNPPVINR
ncbi:MAG: DEAD/DEAH box helicase, partial [Omnitrophica WOR_2 bacterium]